MRVLFDANVFVSFILSPGENITKIMSFWEKKQFRVLISDEIFIEIKQVVTRLLISGLITQGKYESLMRRIEEEAEFVPVFSYVSLSPDRKDNKYLACVKDGRADYLVTGDKKHLLPLKGFGNTKVVSPKGFADILDRLD
ncbi:MAG: putative toxin-antitoxin system toxin component, PIN family [Patescibacteria group bacterium]